MANSPNIEIHIKYFYVYNERWERLGRF